VEPLTEIGNPTSLSGEGSSNAAAVTVAPNPLLPNTSLLNAPELNNPLSSAVN